MNSESAGSRATRGPNYFVIGASKSGTTSLCHLFDQHPRVFVSKPKGTTYFSQEKAYRRGWEWYARHFADAGSATALGEGCVQYTMRTRFPLAAQRLAQAVPEARLIYIVRDPFERMVSQWRMRKAGHRDTVPFDEAVRSTTEALRGRLIDCSKYWFQISAFRDHFPDDRILVVFFEDFKHDAASEVARCFRFLGVDPTFEVHEAERARNTAASRRREGRLLKSLRKVPALGTLRKLVPAAWRRGVKEKLSVYSPEKPAWSPELRKWTADQLADDARTFLKFYGKPEDFWPDLG